MVVTIKAILDEPIKKLLSNDAKIYGLTQLHILYLPYCPWLTGTMYNDVTIDATGILYNTIYAARQYEGDNFNFTKDYHSLACARWAEVAFDLKGDILINDLTNYILKE